MASRLPKKIGSYDVKDLLGKGGMGEVYRASHEVLGRECAIKRLAMPDDLDAGEQAMWTERFLREGKSLSRLNHEGIVAIHDLFEHRKELYMILELVDGFTVAELLKAGALPPDVACILAVQMTRALEQAHLHAIIHRDIKPANVMVSKQGTVKLMDFGIAKDPSSQKLTATGQVVGTPNYIAPEVLAGGEADERSDIYAVGALLYECLSGRRLYGHATPENFFALILGGKFVPLHKVSQGLPRRLRVIVARCLQTRPERRYASAAVLRSELDLFLATHDVVANHTARLVSYLASIGKLAESEALTCIDASDLVIDEGDVALRPRRQPWRIAALSSLLLFVISLGYILTTSRACESIETTGRVLLR